MSENDTPTYQLSIKHGPNDAAMTVIRAFSEREFSAALEVTAANAAEINATVETLRAVSVVASTFPGTTVVGTVPNAAPAATPAQNPQAGAPASGGPNCRHGVMERREAKNSRPGDRDYWWGYFCRLPKTDADRCSPIYPDKNR